MPLPGHLERVARESEIRAYRSSGPGGQHKNKTESSVRVTHLPSGIVRIATEHRSQIRNRRLALERVWKELERRSRPRKKRLATHPTRASQETRLAVKRRAGDTKRLRRAPAED
jgi:peptide chain release factor